MKPTLNSLRQNLKYTYLLVVFFLMIKCQGPEPLDLNNLENGVITFYDDADDEINFPSMNINTIDNQEIVDDPKIDAVVIGRPTTSLVLHTQMIGRGMRGPKMGGTESFDLYRINDELPGVVLADSYFKEIWEYGK